MDEFRSFLGKTVVLSTKGCEPGMTYSGIFYTMDIKKGIFVLRNGLLFFFSTPFFF